jgi:DNA-binding beta-propeller fold protein YncE
MKHRRSLVFLAVALGLSCAGAAVAAEAPGYRVARRWELGGEGGWDYLVVDSAARRLYVSRGTRVLVLDADSGASVGEIPNTEGVHGIALAPDLNRGFTSNGRSSTITIFDLKTRGRIADVQSTGENPDAILYDPATHRVFAFNGRTGNATVLDAAAGTVAGTIPLGGKPEFGVSDGQGRVFVNLEDKNAIAVIDARELKVEKRWPLTGCEEPAGLAIDRARKRLFAGCHNKTMSVVDAVSGKVLAQVPIGQGVDANVFDGGTGLAFSSNGDGTLTVARATNGDKYEVVQTVETQRGARTMALDEKTHTIFLPTAKYGPPPSPTAEQPRPRPSIVPGSFVILVVEKGR